MKRKMQKKIPKKEAKYNKNLFNNKKKYRLKYRYQK